MTYKWWRYAGAAVVFVAAYFLAPVIIYLFNLLTNFFAPRYMQNSDEWLLFISHLLVPLAALWLVDLIVPEAPKFSLALTIIAATYTVFVATWNFTLSFINLVEALSMYGEAVVFIILALHEGGKIKVVEQRQSASDK